MRKRRELINRNLARRVHCRIAVICFLAILSNFALAQAYPQRTIRFVVPFAPGGGTDVMARQIAQKVSESLGQQVVIDNASGAQGNIGTAAVAKAVPDGYTIVVTSVVPFAINPWLYKNVGYDSIKDFTQITLATAQPHVITVKSSVPVTSLKDLVTFIRAHPGQVTYASTGSAGQLAGELLMQMTRTKIIHIPYKGSGLAIIDLLGGHVDMMFASPVTAIEQANSGRIRAIAVTGSERLPNLPLVPTSREAGFPDLTVSSWYGFAAPSGTPKEIINKLNGEIVKAIRSPTVNERLVAFGLTPVGNSPEEMTAFLKSEHARWGKIVQKANVAAE